jgi:hypothetical protein
VCHAGELAARLVRDSLIRGNDGEIPSSRGWFLPMTIRGSVSRGVMGFVLAFCRRTHAQIFTAGDDAGTSVVTGKPAKEAFGTPRRSGIYGASM